MSASPAIRRSVIRIGTRGSQLALWQARAVADRLEAAHVAAAGHATDAAHATAVGARGAAASSGDVSLTCEIVVIKTSGDRLGEAPLSEAGGKRLFVREIEEALLDGRVDIAVHSAKDMPVGVVDGLTIAAVLPREEPWDAIVLPARSPLAPLAAAPGAHPPDAPLARSRPGDSPESRVTVASRGLGWAESSLEQLLSGLGAGFSVGTSSVRRVAQLRRVLRGATFAPIRGNLDTRLRKLDEGQYDLLVLAAAGLKRLGAGDRISARLPLEACIPAPGQGIVAIQVRADDAATHARVARINDDAAARALAAEQAVVAALGGGCQTPIGAVALPAVNGPDVPAGAADAFAADRRLELHAIVVSLDGQRALRTAVSGPAAEAETLGRRAGADLLAQGAAELLADVGHQLDKS